MISLQLRLVPSSYSFSSSVLYTPSVDTTAGNGKNKNKQISKKSLQCAQCPVLALGTDITHGTSLSLGQVHTASPILFSGTTSPTNGYQSSLAMVTTPIHNALTSHLPAVTGRKIESVRQFGGNELSRTVQIYDPERMRTIYIG